MNQILSIELILEGKLKGKFDCLIKGFREFRNFKHFLGWNSTLKLNIYYSDGKHLQFFPNKLGFIEVETLNWK